MSNRHEWTCAEERELARLVSAGMTNVQIAAAMGMSRNSVRAKVYALGLSSGDRLGSHMRKDPAMVAKVHDIIAECVDFRRMPGSHVTRYLRALGYNVSNAWVHKQIGLLGPEFRRWARRNAFRSLSVSSGVARRKQEAEKRRQA